VDRARRLSPGRLLVRLDRPGQVVICKAVCIKVDLVRRARGEQKYRYSTRSASSQLVYRSSRIVPAGAL